MVVSGRRPTNQASSASPATSGAARQADGGFGVVRRLTPSGETVTRRRASRAATAAATGTPTSTASPCGTVRTRSSWKKRSPVNGTSATSGRSSRKSPKPRTVPATAATVDSAAAIRVICRGVAPTRRIAA